MNESAHPSPADTRLGVRMTRSHPTQLSAIEKTPSSGGLEIQR